MGGLDYMIANIFRKEIESGLGKRTLNKIEKRLFERYGITLTESINDFAKFDNILHEHFGRGSKGMIRSILNNLCSLEKDTKKSDSLVTLHDPHITEMILEMLGDSDYRMILDMLIDKSMITYDILDRLDIPQASAYRKIDALVKSGLLVEDGKILLSDTGRPAVMLTTLYRGLDVKIVKNRVITRVMISKKMLAKSTILNTVYSL